MPRTAMPYAERADRAPTELDFPAFDPCGPPAWDPFGTSRFPRAGAGAFRVRSSSVTLRHCAVVGCGAWSIASICRRCRDAGWATFLVTSQAQRPSATESALNTARPQKLARASHHTRR